MTAAFARLGEQAGPVFRKVLRDPRSPLRRPAAWIASEEDCSQIRICTKVELAAVFDDKDKEVRKGVQSTLRQVLEKSELGDERPAMLRAITSPDAEVRDEALSILVRMNEVPDEVIHRLAAILRDSKDEDSIGSALWYVARLGPRAAAATPAVIDVLKGPILKGGKWELFQSVAETLSILMPKDESVAPMLKRALLHLLPEDENLKGYYLTTDRQIRAVVSAIDTLSTP